MFINRHMHLFLFFQMKQMQMQLNEQFKSYFSRMEPRTISLKEIIYDWCKLSATIFWIMLHKLVNIFLYQAIYQRYYVFHFLLQFRCYCLILSRHCSQVTISEVAVCPNILIAFFAIWIKVNLILANTISFAKAHSFVIKNYRIPD